MPSIETLGITIVNRHTEKEDIYIGRGSPLGNPFTVEEHGREKCIELYKVYLMDQIQKGNTSIINALAHIKEQSRYKEVKLGCFCKPKKCHGDVIKAYIESSKPVKVEKKIYAFTGHRPDKLGGYKIPNPVFLKVYQAITDLLVKDKPDEIISGMALGIDQWAADIAIDLGIPVIAAIPFKGQESVWPEKSVAIYQYLLSKVSKQVIVSTGDYSAKKLQIRNEWMVDNCTTLVAVWNGSSGGTANCITYAQSINREIIYIPL